MSYEVQVENQIRSFILFITFMIKSCVVFFLFPFPQLPAVCLWCRLSAARLSAKICFTVPSLTVTPKQRMSMFTTPFWVWCGFSLILPSSFFCIWWITSKTHNTLFQHKSASAPSNATAATLRGVVRSGERHLCELYRMLPLGSYCTLTMENHTKLLTSMDRRSTK